MGSHEVRDEHPNEESLLDWDADRRAEDPPMDEFVADGLTDEENVSEPSARAGVEAESPAYESGPSVVRVDIDAMVDRICELLARKQDDAPVDVYAWSNGAVSNGEEPADDDVFMVSLFSPDDDLNREEVRAMLVEGFKTVAVEPVGGGSGA